VQSTEIFVSLKEKKQNIVNLREFRDSDKIRLAELCNNKKIWDNVRDILPFPYTEKDAEYFIKKCMAENPKCTFVIEYNGEFVGCIGLELQTDIHKFSAELGYWIGEPFWGLGIATKAVEQIEHYGFSNLKLTRIYANVYDFNKASQCVLEKSGFLKEGIFQKSVYKNGQFCNEYRYGKIND
jgi:RimJ/RimL family protein N-acetyltransferase